MTQTTIDKDFHRANQQTSTHHRTAAQQVCKYGLSNLEVVAEGSRCFSARYGCIQLHPGFSPRKEHRRCRRYILRRQVGVTLVPFSVIFTCLSTTDLRSSGEKDGMDGDVYRPNDRGRQNRYLRRTGSCLAVKQTHSISAIRRALHMRQRNAGALSSTVCTYTSRICFPRTTRAEKVDASVWEDRSQRNPMINASVKLLAL